jgi:hypothetical protein
VEGEGVEWRARVRSGGSPSAGAVGLEFPSNSLRKEFWSSLRRELEGNSKGDGTLTRRVGHILQPSLIALPRTVARSPSKEFEEE